MDNIIPENLEPYFSLKTQNALKAEKQHNTITFNPSSAKSRETLTVRMPKLTKDLVIVPGTMRLLFDVKVDSEQEGDGLKENVSRNLICEISYKFAGEMLSDLKFANIFHRYKDKWMSENKKINMRLEGLVQAEDSPNVKEVFGNKYCINLDHEILECHGAFYPYALNQHLQVDITLAKNGDVCTGKATYELQNIELEYVTIRSPELASSIEQAYNNGLSFAYEQVHFHVQKSVKKNENLITETINIPRRSVKGILLLPQDKNGKFMFPKIKKVEATIEGSPNKLYNQGLKPYHFFDEACKYFGLNQNLKNYFDGDCFGLWLDLRSHPDHSYHGSGLKIQNTKDGIQLRIEKDDCDEDFFLYVYVVSDALFVLQDKEKKLIQY